MIAPNYNQRYQSKRALHGMIECSYGSPTNSRVNSCSGGGCWKHARDCDKSGRRFALKRFCVDYADRIPRLMDKKIDEIEATLKKRFPALQHMDIEIN